MDNIKFKISMGNFTAEIEATADFVQNEFVGMIEELNNILGSASNRTTDSSLAATSFVGTSNNGIHVTTSMFAAKISAKSGSDLVSAAGYKLTHEGKDSFTRSDLLNEMQQATSYYNTNYRKNLSNHIKTLVTGKHLNELGNNKFSLPANERSKIQDIVKEF